MRETETENDLLAEIKRLQDKIAVLEERRAEAPADDSGLILQSVGEAIYGIDTEGRCTFCNPACLQILGYDHVDQLLGQNMHDLIHYSKADGSAYPATECQIYLAFRSGKGVTVDDEVLWRADGTNFQAEYRSFPIHSKDGVIGAVVSSLIFLAANYSNQKTCAKVRRNFITS